MFRGAIGKPKEGCKRTRERTVGNPTQCTLHPSQTQQPAVAAERTRYPPKNQENDLLTTKPLSGMGHRVQLWVGPNFAVSATSCSCDLPSGGWCSREKCSLCGLSGSTDPAARFRESITCPRLDRDVEPYRVVLVQGHKGCFAKGGGFP